LYPLYSREEIKKIRKSFWKGFQKYSSPRRRNLAKPKSWQMQNTGIKALDLKFEFDSKQASVGIDIVSKSVLLKDQYWDKLLSLKNILTKASNKPLNRERNHKLESGKEIIRVALIKTNVNIMKPECWQDVYGFFFYNMMKFESFLDEYKEFIRVRQGS
jgi:hypothetical protein